MTVSLNKNGEVADLLNVDQFVGGRSAYECVAYCAALVKYAGQPGAGPSGTVAEASALAQSWYAREEGSNAASNTNGMSLDQEYNMLTGLGVKFQPLAATLADVKAASGRGDLVMLCGPETCMYDMVLGRVPYAWTPSGNHCIVVSGVAPDGNLLVHDCASIAPNGVRPGPRKYSASALANVIVSATAIITPWTEETQMLQLTDPMGKFFTANATGDRWSCKEKNTVLAYGLLNFYRRNMGIFGLPITNELYLAQYPGTAIQVCERAIPGYDPARKIEPGPPGASDCYLLHIDGGIGQQLIAKPLIVELQAQIDSLNSQIAALKANPGDPATVAALQTQLASYKQAVGVVRNAINGY